MKKMTTADWQTLRNDLNIDGRAFINGERVAGEQTVTATTPIDNSALAEVTFCTEAQTNEAVAHARAAFESGIWASQPPAKKKAVLYRFADLMEENYEELALLETLDSGKPIANAHGYDVRHSINCIRWYGEALDKIYGEIPNTGEGALALIRREPIGVVGGILPWNFPLLLLCWKIAPALALGNSLVIKPSEKTSLVTLRVAELAHQAGIPAGVFSVVPGWGHEVGGTLSLHNDVDCLVFTGSTATAKRLLEASGQSNMKPVYAETGGKSANIVFADCYDLDKAAEGAVHGVFYNQGQVCIAGTRLLVEESIYEQFVEKVIEKSSFYQTGNPLDTSCSMGCLIDGEHASAVTAHIDNAVAEGAELLLDGRNAGTNQVGPTIFKTTPKHKVACEEVFGPVLSVMTFKTEEEAIALANDSIYGLGAAAWTADLNKAHRMAKALRAGSVFINNYNHGDLTVPWSGYKQSGNGSDKSLHAFDKFSETKVTWIDLGAG
ncbi:MAG: aldehyde dehydrogenase PuuC [Gammaproteobacteria bacterium]|nr:MAG: aldehyde dehydrogenase PuuC [Gammaproteobacteria bacterium]